MCRTPLPLSDQGVAMHQPTTDARPAPLSGVRVIDLTRVLAGPYATMVLSDLGAEVIKIERPCTGDDSRGFGPFRDGSSGYFASVNRGKQSCTVDLKTDEGRDLSLIHISEPTRLGMISYAVFCLKKKK